MRISNNAKLIMADGAYKDFRRPYPRHPRGIPEGSAGRGRGQTPCGNAPPPPPCLPVSLEQLLVTQNDFMCLIVENEMRRGAER
jgi:hypothetical protein